MNRILDKNTEKNRFNERAKKYLNEIDPRLINGSNSICESLRSPYLFFENLIKENLKENMMVLEIGSGNGEYTGTILKTGAKVVATDIAPNCLQLIDKRYSNFKDTGQLKTVIADMENLPFDNEHFHAVVIAGSLSYGESNIVDKEIFRILMKNGSFICVDSLNNNVIYKTNRYINYLKNKRSRLTINNMPDLNRIQKIRSFYKYSKVSFFGSLSWFFLLIKFIIGAKRAKLLSDFFDNSFNIKRSAFKFVLIAKK